MATEASGDRKPVAIALRDFGSGATVAPLVTIIEMPRK